MSGNSNKRQVNDSVLGEMLRSARLDAGLSQRKVEENTGISNAYLSQLESGKVREPSPRVLYKLSDEYGLDYAELLDAAGYPVPAHRERSRSAFRQTSSLGPVTKEEEKELKEYLAFLRMKRRGGK